MVRVSAGRRAGSQQAVGPRRRSRGWRLLRGSAILLCCGLLTGVVVATAVFPMVAIVGLAAKTGADEFDRLPTQLAVVQSPQISYVYASDRKTLVATFYDEDRKDVPVSEVAPVMRQAIIAAEDMRLSEHP